MADLLFMGYAPFIWSLEFQNIVLITAAINNFRGTLIVVSHDAVFLKEVGVEREVDLG